MNNCPFCNLKQTILKENDSAIVLLSDPHLVKGHFLVVPKRHVDKPWELSQTELQNIFELIFFIERRVIDKLGSGCDIRQNYRPFIKQGAIKVDHVHFHILPRTFQDELYEVSSKHETAFFKPLNRTEHDEVAKLLG